MKGSQKNVTMKENDVNFRLVLFELGYSQIRETKTHDFYVHADCGRVVKLLKILHEYDLDDVQRILSEAKHYLDDFEMRVVLKHTFNTQTPIKPIPLTNKYYEEFIGYKFPRRI